MLRIVFLDTIKMVSILIIDDEPGARTLLAMALNASGTQVKTAATATEARAVAESAAFDWIICDVKLPDGNGLDLAEDLREIQPNARIVVISAVVSEDEVARVPSVVAYWHKPFDPLAMRNYILNDERPTAGSSGLRSRQFFL